MTLVEVMVAVAVSAVVLSSIATLAIRLQRWDQRFRYHAICLTEQFRMSEALRADLQNAVDVKIANDKSLEVAVMEGKPISYSFQPDGCARNAPSIDGIPHVELFSIGAQREWKVEKDQHGRMPSVIVSLASDTEENRSPQPFAVYGQLRHSTNDGAPADPSPAHQSSAQEKVD